MAAKKKLTKKNNSTKNSSTVSHIPDIYPLRTNKPVEKLKRVFHAVGVLQAEQEVKASPYHEGVYQQFTPEEIASHIPQYNVIPYSH